MMNPELYPFDAALRNLQGVPPALHDSLVQVGDTLDMAKKMLLQSRVREFTGADVVAVTRLILEREQLLTLRAQQEEQTHDDDDDEA